MTTWLTAADDLGELWPDAPMDETILAIYLAAAKEACEAFAPDLPEGVTEIPEGWQLAQAMQARNTFNAVQASPGGTLDGSGFGLTTFPMDWMVKQLLRPRRAVGAIV